MNASNILIEFRKHAFTYTYWRSIDHHRAYMVVKLLEIVSNKV